MEDFKKPSLDKVIKKLEGLDIREWKREKRGYVYKFIARLGGLTIYISTYNNNGTWIRTYHIVQIINQNGDMDVSYLYPKKNSVEEKCISKLYDKLNEKYEKYFKKEYFKKEFEENLEQVFSD